MKNITFLLLTLIFQFNLANCQNKFIPKIDSIVSIAISNSENALFDASFNDGLELIQTSSFENIMGYSDKHQIMLVLQEMRITGFKNIVYQQKTDNHERFRRLQELFSKAQNLKHKSTRGQYYLMLSGSYRSLKNSDSAIYYQEQAIKLFEEENDLEQIAIIRAGNISRNHNRLLRENKKQEILELIPKYETEIKFSEQHSKYALAYNTRHLAQIHRTQTLNYSASLKLFKISLHLREEIGFRPFLPASYSSLGDVNVKLDEYYSAIEMYKKASELASNIGFIRYQTIPNLNIGDIYKKLAARDKALEYYMKGLESAIKNNYTTGIEQAKNKIDNLEL